MSAPRLFLVVVFSVGLSARSANAICPDAQVSDNRVKRVVLEERDAAAKSAPEARQLKVIRLERANAPKVATLLSKVIPNYGSELHVSVVADPRTNSLIVTGSLDGQRLVNTLVSDLDTNAPPTGPAEADPTRRARVGVTVYQIEVPSDRVAEVDVAALTAHADSVVSLKAALTKLGEAKIACRGDVILKPDGRTQKTNFGSQMPFVRSSSRNKQGNTTASIEYESVGVNLEASGELKSLTYGTAEVEIEFAGVTDSGVEVGNGIMAPVIRKFTQQFSGGFKHGVPVLLLIVDAQADETATMYVTRIEFTIETLP